MSGRRCLAAFAAAAVPLALLVYRFDFLCDDAFISFRYARHLARGEGLRFNLGVEPPVEGYTNLLWVLWCAVSERLALDVGSFARATSVLLAFATLFLVVRLLAARSGGGLAAPLFGGLFVGLHPSFGVWATGGMETMAFTACAFLGFERLVLDPERPRAVQAGLAFAAAALLRADGVVACGAALAGAWLLGLLDGRSALRRAAFAALVAVVATVALHVLFRWSYHGDVVPNTAHAKVGLDSAVAWRRGAVYAAHFLVLFPAVALAPVLGSLARGASRRAALAALVPFAAVYLWTVAAGGDYMAFGRFLVPAIPFAAVAFGLGAAEAAVAGARVRPAGVACAGVLLATQVPPAFGLGVAPPSWLAALNFRLDKAYVSQVEAWEGLVKGVARGTIKGRALGALARPGDSLVAGNVGAQAYYSGVFVHDRYGLVTREVALRDVEQAERAAGHAKGVSALWFLDRRPTVIALELAPLGRGALGPPPAAVRADYVTRIVPVEGGLELHMLVRRDSHLARVGAEG